MNSTTTIFWIATPETDNLFYMAYAANSVVLLKATIAGCYRLVDVILRSSREIEVYMCKLN